MLTGLWVKEGSLKNYRREGGKKFFRPPKSANFFFAGKNVKKTVFIHFRGTICKKNSLAAFGGWFFLVGGQNF